MSVGIVTRVWAGCMKNCVSVPWKGKGKSTDENQERLIWNNRLEILWLLFLLTS